MLLVKTVLLEIKLNQAGVATAQVASNLNLSNEFIILNYELETNTRSLVFDSQGLKQHTTQVKTKKKTFQDSINYQQTSLHIMTVEFLAKQSLAA